MSRKPLSAPAAGEKPVLAVIELGAHSARMLIAECTASGRIRILEDLDVSVPLGGNVFHTGAISSSSIRILCDVLRGFREKMKEYGVSQYRAIATSAVREATNTEILLERIRHETGIEVRIFEGADEARLNYISVKNILPESSGFASGRAMIVDIGTGVCQISTYEKGSLAFTETLKLGTLRVLELMPGALSIPAMREHLTPVINNAFDELKHSGTDFEGDLIIAVGSSVRTLIRIFLENAGRKTSASRTHRLSRKDFEIMHERTSSLSLEQISAKFDVPKDLAETVMPCAVILDDLFRLTGASELLVPMVSLKQGLMFDFVHEILTGTDHFEDQILGIVRKTALRYHCVSGYFEQVVRCAEILFRKLVPLHGLRERDLLLLKIAAILHKSGLFINNQGYHKHSAYIISSIEIPGLSMDERMIAAMTARYHRKAIPMKQHQEFQSLPPLSRSRVLKLSAILRIACLLAARGIADDDVSVKLESDRVLIRTRSPRGIPEPSSVLRTDLDYFSYVFAVQTVLQ